MIYFVRHGETDYNVEKKTQGQTDTMLNAKGLKQTKQAGLRFKDVQIDVIYSSPLTRARLLAEEINKYHRVEIVYDNRLKQRSAGSREGLLWDDFSEHEKELWQTNPELWGAETRMEFYKRTIEFFREVENTNKNIVIVSHRGVWRNFMRYFDNENTDFTKDLTKAIGNCEIEILDKYMHRRNTNDILCKAWGNGL